VHRYTAETEQLAQAVLDYARHRLRLDPVPLDGPRTVAELDAAVGHTITPAGLGGEEALRLFADELSHACISVDNPRYLSFIPAAPTEAATLFDLVVGASSIYGGSWLEGSGAIYAENQALRWIADLAGLPPQAGGVFVQGGTLGNLSALVAARHAARLRRTGPPPARWTNNAGTPLASESKATISSGCLSSENRRQHEQRNEMDDSGRPGTQWYRARRAAPCWRLRSRRIWRRRPWPRRRICYRYL
jgi:hypothetical protein